MDTCGYALNCPPPPPPPLEPHHLLPFTGLDLTFFVLLGVIILVSGVVLRLQRR